MKFCQKCGKELNGEEKFCESCGASVATDIVNDTLENQEVAQETAVDSSTENKTIVETKMPVKIMQKVKSSKKLMAILAAALVALIVGGILIGNAVSLNKYKENLEAAYDKMLYGAETAESYASLQSKVWRNCIYKESSVETDKYTKNSYGSYYSDFNDALSSFYKGEALTYSLVSVNVSSVNGYMSELKDCPKKYEDEYRALKELYVAYSELTDLVIGGSSYSWKTFNEALETAKSDYKNAVSSAKLLLE